MASRFAGCSLLVLATTAACGDPEGGGTSTDTTSAAGAGGPGSMTTGTPTGGTTSGGVGGGDGGAGGNAGGGGGGPTDDASCRNGWCWVIPSVDGTGFNAVAVDAADNVWFGGLTGSLLRWDGASFQRHLPDGSADQWDIVPIDANHVNANGWLYDGTDWTSALPVLGKLDDGTLIGSDGTLQLWDGTMWSAGPVPPFGVYSVVTAWGSSPDDIRFLLENGSVQAYVSGGWGAIAPTQGWDLDRNEVLVFPGGELAAITTGAPTALWIFESNAWTMATPVQSPRLIAGRSKSDLTIYRGGVAGNRAHWDGVQLTDLGGYEGDVWAIAEASDGAIYEAGNAGLLRKFHNGTETMLQDGPFPGWSRSFLHDEGPETTLKELAWIDGKLWVATNHEEVLIWDGSTWDSLPLVDGPAHSIWGQSENDVWFAGDEYIGFNDFDQPAFHHTAQHFDGTTVSLVYEVPESSDRLYGVWGTGPNDVYIWGRGPNSTKHFDGSTWAPVSGRIRHGSGPDDVWLSTSNSLQHWDGTAWTTYPFIGTGFVHALYSFGPGDVWVQHFDDIQDKSSLYSLNGNVLFQKSLPPQYDNQDGPRYYFRTAADQHHLLFSGDVWQFTGDDPLVGTSTPTAPVPLTFYSAVVDRSGKLLVRSMGGVMRQQ